MTKFLALCLFLGMAAPAAVSAKGVAVTPGLWEMSMSMNMPMMPVPQERSYTECVQETEIDPEKFQMDQETPCDVNDMVVDGKTISWSLSCPGPMGTTEGQWSFTSEGDSMHGNGAMTAEMGGQNMEFTMSWKGKRIGDCEQADAQ